MVSAVATAFAAVVAVVASVVAVKSAKQSEKAVVVAQQALRDDHDYQRRLYAAELISRWDERTMHARSAIMRRWSERYQNNEAIPRAEIDAEFKKEVDASRQGTDPVMVHHFGTLLNYLDDVAIAAMFKVGDDSMLKAAFEATFKRWMRVLGEYREHVISLRKIDPWARLDELSREWSDSAPAAQPTGAITTKQVA